MEKFKGTPGPYVAQVADNGGFFIEAPKHDGLVLCSRNPWPHRAEESQANAALFAESWTLLDGVAGLFRGGFIDAGTRDHSEWAQELERRLVPLRAALARTLQPQEE